MENKLYKKGKECLGKDMSRTQDIYGCVEAVREVVRLAIGQEIGGELSTIKLYNSLLLDNRFQRVYEPQKGDIIISPTNGRYIGHAGIISDKGRVMSNNSANSLWDEHLSISDWWLKYKNLPIVLFRYIEPVIIKPEELEQKKISILQKIVELYKQIISLKLKNMKFGALSSSQNPEKLSLTVKSIVAGLLPVIHLITGVELVNETVDKIIDAVFTLFTAFLAIKGYIRAKR